MTPPRGRRSMNILVLGGTVFIGLHLVQLLSRQGHAVTVLNRGVSDAVLPDGVERLYADRTDPSKMRSVLKNTSYDVVFDISCYTPEALEPVIGALDGNVGHFVFCSTTSVYAPAFLAPIQEDFPLDRRPDASDYSRNKIVCEDMLTAAVADRGFPATILRPPYVYGPHNKIRQREFRFFARLSRGRTIIVPGDGHTLTQPVHVDDLAEAFASVPGRTHTARTGLHRGRPPGHHDQRVRLDYRRGDGRIAVDVACGRPLLRVDGRASGDRPHRDIPFRVAREQPLLHREGQAGARLEAQVRDAGRLGDDLRVVDAA